MGRGPDPAFPLLFHENPASRIFCIAIPNPVFSFPKNTFKKTISAKANKMLFVHWPFRLIFSVCACLKATEKRNSFSHLSINLIFLIKTSEQHTATDLVNFVYYPTGFV